VAVAVSGVFIFLLSLWKTVIFNFSNVSDIPVFLLKDRLNKALRAMLAKGSVSELSTVMTLMTVKQTQVSVIVRTVL